MRSFASDNNSGVHPAVMEALTQTNLDHAVAYGDDPWTETACEQFRREFGPQAQTFFVFLGTGANVLCLSSLAQPWQAVISANHAHANVDECGAPERFGGFKMLSVPAKDGKLTPDMVRPFLHSVGFQHHNQPAAVTITQPTELGVLYQPEEIAAISAFCREHGLWLHMDGARLANAAAALDMDLKALTVDLGVDALSFGGTKNGLMYGEAVVFFSPKPAENFMYIRKQGMQLASKMRYISAQFSALLQDGLWRRNAAHANAMAALLGEQAAALQSVQLTRPVETNAVFARLPTPVISSLQQDFMFYVWNPEDDPSFPDTQELRWMCSFDSSEQDVATFVKALEKCLNRQ